MLLDVVAEISRDLGIGFRAGAQIGAQIDTLLRQLRKSGSSVLKPSIGQAKAFEISWLTISVIAGQEDPEPAIKQIKGFLDDLEIVLPEPLRSYIHTEDDGDSVMRFLELAGRQVAVRRPDLAPFFEGGANLLIDFGRGGGKRFWELLQTLGLPSYLLTPTQDLVRRASEVHWYFKTEIDASGASH
jgi:hypothetical protein